jgi:hypothetical protein
MFEDTGVPVARTVSVRRAVRVVVAGIGVALLGHVLAAVVTYAVARTLGGGGADADLDAGGRFAVVFFALSMYGGSQVVLFVACLSVALASMRRNRGFGIGVLVGWAAGVLTAATYLAVLVFNASRYSAG